MIGQMRFFTFTKCSQHACTFRNHEFVAIALQIWQMLIINIGNKILAPDLLSGYLTLFVSFVKHTYFYAIKK